MDYKKDTLKDFISLIKERTSMYIGRRTISILKAFIDGWIYGSEDEIADINLISDFQKWLEVKFNISGYQSWAPIILFYSIDEYSALDRLGKSMSQIFCDKYLKYKNCFE